MHSSKFVFYGTTAKMNPRQAMGCFKGSAKKHFSAGKYSNERLNILNVKSLFDFQWNKT